MFNQAELEDFKLRLDAYKASQPKKAAPKVQQPKKTGRGGILSSLTSEGGALGGAATGAAIGSAVPVLGTAIGGVLGGALGAFGGRIAENKVRDDRLGIGDAAKEATLTGVLGAPGKLLKYGATTAKAIKGGTTLTDALAMGAKRLENTAPGATLGATAAAAPMRTSTSGKLDELANKALTNQYGTISKPVARATNPERTFSRLSEVGITKPQDVERIASSITGTNGLLNRAVVKATGNSNRVDVSNLRQVLTDSMENNGVVDSRAKELTTMFDAQMKRLFGGPKGSLSTTANPSDVLDVMKAFEKRIAQKSGKGSNYRLATDETMSQANALRLVVDELQGRLESGADVKKVLTPQLRNKLLSLQPNNAKWQSYVDNEIMKSTDIKNLRSAQAPFVNARKIIDEADMNSLTFGGRAGNAAGSIKDTLMNAVVASVKNPALRAASSTLKAVGGLVGNTGAPSLGVIPQGAKIGASGVAGEGLISALMNPRPANAMQQPQIATTSAMGLPPVSAPAPMPDSSNQDANNPFAAENLQASVQKIIENGGSLKDAADFVGLASALSKMQGSSEPAKPGYGRPSAQQYSQASTGLKSVDQLTDILSKDSGVISRNATPGQGVKLLGGLLSGQLNTSEYRAVTNNILNTIARINTGAAMPPSEEGFYQKTYIPQPGDSEATKQNKLQTLIEFFTPLVDYQGAESR